MYEDYVRTRSFRGDLLILLRTAVSLGRSPPSAPGMVDAHAEQFCRAAVYSVAMGTVK